MNRFNWFLHGFSHKVSLNIGLKKSKSFPVYFVCGFPRSGTSWLSDVVANYYNIPKPKHYFLPIAFASVLHTHSLDPRRAKNTFYIHRDCRSAYVSMFNYIVHTLCVEKDYIHRKRYESYISFNKNNNLINPKKSFYHFLMTEVNKNDNWSNHVSRWINVSKKNQEISIIAFNDLVVNTFSTMHSAIQLLDGEVNDELLKKVIEFNSIETQKLRPKKQHTTFLSGSKLNTWKTLKSEKSEKLIKDNFGELMTKLGYLV